MKTFILFTCHPIGHVMFSRLTIFIWLFIPVITTWSRQHWKQNEKQNEPHCQKFEDSEGVIRSRKEKDRHHNGQNKMYKRTNNDLQNITEKSKERATQKNSIKTRGEPRCSGRVNSSFSTRGTRKVPKSNRKFVDTPSTHIHHLSPTPSTHIHHLSTTPSTHIHHLSATPSTHTSPLNYT